MVYEGRWWTPEREALDALVDVTQRPVTGIVRLRLYKGTATVIGRDSPFSLYQPQYATFEADHVYNHADAAGFIRLFGLPVRIGAEVRRRAAVDLPVA
jgi:argininosuccinate synthase